MNKQESDILNTLLLEPFINQRILAEVSGHSLGVVNRSLKELIKTDYLDDSIRPTVKAITEFKQKTPQRAIILAAGFGMRMVPINTEMPKGLLEVNGEPLIERIIKQLHEVGIKEIYVVVGFMKEKYEYRQRVRLRSKGVQSAAASARYSVPCQRSVGAVLGTPR